MADDRGFESRIARVEALTAILERCTDPGARAASRELVGVLLDLHGEGLSKILAMTSAAGEPGRAIASAFARDGLVANLLLLHGLHPEGLGARVRAALEAVRPRLGHGVGLELVELDGMTLRLRLGGGCPSSGGAKRKAVEDALLAAAPDLETVEFLELAGPTTGFFSLPVITL